MDKNYYKKKINGCLLNRERQVYADYLREKYQSYRYICVFGVGNMGIDLPAELNKYGIKVNFFCDNDKAKTGRSFKGIPCISLEELCRYKDDIVILIATRYYKDIYQQLTKLGFKHLDRILDNKFMIDSYLENADISDVSDKLQKVVDIVEDDESAFVLSRIVEEWCRNQYQYGQLDDIWSERQYFDESIVQLENNEIFVDCGAYTGDTLVDYIEASQGNFQTVCLFELSHCNFVHLLQRIDKHYLNIKQRLEPVNCGVAERTSQIYYHESDEGSGLSDDGDTLGQITSLDDYFYKRDVTFIKMDIEGAELKALQGASRLIKRCSPKLAICLYHKPQDLWEIPILIKQINPNYKLYIRHYTDLMNETVCYAVN